MKVLNVIKENKIKIAGIGLSIAGFALQLCQNAIDNKQQENMISAAVDEKIASIIEEGSEDEK